MLQRREFMKVFSAVGQSGTLLPGVLWVQSQGKTTITKEMIDDAAKIAGIAIPAEYKELMLDNLNHHAKSFDEIFQLHMPNSVQPALLFLPETSGVNFDTQRTSLRMSGAPVVATTFTTGYLKEASRNFVPERGWSISTSRYAA